MFFGIYCCDLWTLQGIGASLMRFSLVPCDIYECLLRPITGLNKSLGNIWWMFKKKMICKLFLVIALSKNSGKTLLTKIFWCYNCSHIFHLISKHGIRIWIFFLSWLFQYFTYELDLKICIANLIGWILWNLTVNLIGLYDFLS